MEKRFALPLRRPTLTKQAGISLPNFFRRVHFTTNEKKIKFFTIDQ